MNKFGSYFLPCRTEVLLNNPDFYIDETFFNKMLRGKYLLGLKRKRVKVSQLKRQIDKKIYTLYESPLYESLNKRDPNDTKSDRYGDLIRNIEKNGFNSRSVIVCKYNSNLIKDGQHRAIYMLWKYGPDYEMDTIHIRVKTDLLRFRILPFLKRFCRDK